MNSSNAACVRTLSITAWNAHNAKRLFVQTVRKSGVEEKITAKSVIVKMSNIQKCIGFINSNWNRSGYGVKKVSVNTLKTK